MMSSYTKPRYSSQELSQRLTEHIQELAEATDAARMSEAMLTYLEMCARFHHYSPNNVWLILMACPHATQVAGYHKWRDLGRYVCKGERGIPILAPIFVKKIDSDDEDDKELIGFKVVYVYDISQTDGESLPVPPNWKSPEKDLLLQESLIQFANSKGITVECKDLAGDIQGVSQGGKVFLSPQAGTKTLIHELAHELMHQNDDRPESHTIRELEAESVAYVVGKHFGLDSLNSPNYVGLCGADSSMILDHLGRIRKTASEIIGAIEN